MALFRPLTAVHAGFATALKRLGNASLACVAVAGTLLASNADAAPYAYVPDTVSDKLTVFDLGTGAAVSRYSVAGFPGGVGFMRSAVVRTGAIANEIYITNHDTNELLAFNLALGVVTGRCTTGAVSSTSRGLAITPLGDKVIVTNESETSSGKDVQIFSLPLPPAGCVATANISRIDKYGTASIITPGNAYAAAVNPTGTKAYIPLGIDKVGVLDLITNKWTKLIDVGASSGPTFIAFNAIGTKAYVTLSGSGKVGVIDTGADTFSAATIAVGSVPRMAVMSAALLYVLNVGDNSISIIDTITNTVVSTYTIGSNTPSFNVLTATGELILADDATNEIHRAAVSPPFLQGPAISGGNLNFPGPYWTPIPISSFGPTVPNLPVWSNIPVQGVLAGQAASFDLSTFLAVTLGVTSYTLTGSLPSGLSFDSSNGKITGNSGVEGSVNLKISATNAFGDSTPKAFTLTIGNAGVISFASATQTINENVGTLAIPVTRTSNATGGVGAVSATCTAVDGTATAGMDFTATVSTLNWADGVNGSVMCNIPVINDAVFEPTKTFTVTLTNPTNGVTLGAITTVTVTLNDDDPMPAKTPPVMSNMPAQVGKVGVAFSYNTATSCAKTQGDPILGYALASGTLPSNVTLNTMTGIISGTPTTAGVANVTISCSDMDGASVPAGTLQITISPLTPGALTFAGAATRTIAENGGALALSVDRVGGSDGAIGVTCAAVDGTAKAGSDFTATNVVLTWADGDSGTKACNVPIINDAIQEPTEAFSVVLNTPTGGATLGAQTSIAVTVTDDDAAAKTPPTMANMAAQIGKAGAAFSFNAAAACTATDGDPITGYSVASGTLPANVTLNAMTGLISGTPTAAVVSNVTIACSDIDGTSNPAGSLQITISTLVPGVLSFSGAATRTIAENGGALALSVDRVGGTDGAIGVTCAAINGTATAGLDFTATSLTLSWADGDSGTKACNVLIINDAIPEPTKTFSVALSNPMGGATLGAPASIAVTLTDDDGPAKTPPTMMNLAAQAGTVNTAFSFSPASSCTPTDGDPITGYTLASGILPAGITLNGTSGLISGTPTVAGTSNVSIKCSDVDGLSATAGTLAIMVAPQTAYSATSATASGIISVAISGGGASCGFGKRQFIPVAGNAASPPVAPPAGTTFPHGLFDFTLNGCAPGSAVTLTVTYPAALAAGTQYYKYGPTPSNAAATWYVLPSTVSGNTVTFTISDGALGDDDLIANGTIVDQGGPSVPPAAVATPAVNVPTLHPAMIALLALLLALLGRLSLGFSRRTF